MYTDPVHSPQLTKKPHTPEDLIDQRKEDEEKMLIAEVKKRGQYVSLMAPLTFIR